MTVFEIQFFEMSANKIVILSKFSPIFDKIGKNLFLVLNILLGDIKMGPMPLFQFKAKYFLN